jgi:cyclic pyranopterin phosphate synthase
MVDVSDKPITRRRAVAEGRVRISSALAKAIKTATVPKGNLLEVARIAGIQAAKQTDRLVPLCHSLPLEFVDVSIELLPDAVSIRAEVVTTSSTGGWSSTRSAWSRNRVGRVATIGRGTRHDSSSGADD